MTEQEYIDLTNLTKLRIARNVLGEYHPVRKFSEEIETIYEEIQRIEKKLDQQWYEEEHPS